MITAGPGSAARFGIVASLVAGTIAFLFVSAPLAAQTGSSLEAGHAAARRGDHPAAWRHYLRAYDPAADDPRVLSALAVTAARIDSLGRLATLLDGALNERPEATHALRVWGAITLQSGGSPTTVVDRYAIRLADRGYDGEAVLSLASVLEGHGAFRAAEALLERARVGGAPPAALARARGEVRQAAGDPEGALEAYLAGIEVGPSEPLLERIEALLEAWPEDPPVSVAAERLARAAAEMPGATSALSILAVRARVRAGRWDEALLLAERETVDPATRIAILRQIAGKALEAGALGAAERAARAILDADPAGDPADRALAADIARARGDAEAAAAGFREAARRGAPGASGRALLAEIDAARASGDSDRLGEALSAARNGRVDPALIAVEEGDLWLARGRPDSAVAAYLRAVDGRSDDEGIDALGRARLVGALGRANAEDSLVSAVGAALVRAPADPATAAERFGTLAARLGSGDSVATGRALLLGLAGEWLGRSGDPAGASAGLERAARDPSTGPEAAGLLLAAGTWAIEAGKTERGRNLLREVAVEHPATPHALEARRLLASGDGTVGGEGSDGAGEARPDALGRSRGR